MTPELIRSFAQALLSNAQPAAAKEAAVPAPQAPLMPNEASQEALRAPAANSPLSNEVEAKVEPGVVQGQTQAILQNDQARAQQEDLRQRGLVNVNDNLPTDTAIVGPNGEPMNADALMRENVNARDSAASGNSQVAHAQAKAARDQTDFNTQMAAVNQPAEEFLHKRIEEGYADLHNAGQEVASQSQAAIANYQAMQDQMRQIAVQDPKSIWGQSGVNKVLGLAGIFLGGAGPNGNHANRQMETLNALADRNIASQRQQFEMLSKVGEGDRTLYGMLQSKLQNKDAVESSLRNAALESYKSMLRMNANQYAGPAGKVALEAQLAKIGDYQNTNNQSAAQSYLKNGEHILAIRGQENATKVAQNAAAMEQNKYVMENGVDGVLGYVPPAAHERISKMTGGARTLISMTNHVEQMIEAGASMATIREYMVANAVQFKGARDFLETGTRIEEGEQRIINQLNPSAKESIFSAFTRTDPTKLKEKLEAIKATVTEAAWTEIHTTAPNTTAFDKRDALWGGYEPGSYKGPAQRELERMNGNPKGRPTLDSLSAYNAGPAPKDQPSQIQGEGD